MKQLTQTLFVVSLLLVAACQSGGGPTTPQSLDITPQNASVTAGSSLQLVVTDSNGEVLNDGASWLSSHPHRVAVDGNGMITGGYGEGQATISVVARGASASVLADLSRVCTTLAPINGQPNPDKEIQRFDVAYEAGTDSQAQTQTLSGRYGFRADEVRSDGFTADLTPTQAAGVGCAQAVASMTYL